MTRSWRNLGIAFAGSVLLAGCTVLHPPAPSMPSRANIVSGETITVKGSENVYAVAREHNVSMRELIVLNNLQPPFALKPGQSLVLPGGTNGTAFASSTGLAPGVAAAPSGAIETAPLAPIEVAPLSPPTFPADTKKNNTLTAPVETLNAPAAPPKSLATTVAPAAAPAPGTKMAASTSPVAPAASSLASTPPPPSTAMMWPVQGPILSSFGPKGQGLNNDGVNIGAPKGSPVVAASGGTVVYAGNEMKGFGNLVLIRHQEGWVTAYAHLDRMLVAKDAVVAQGDEIGTVGKTGNVPSPQLHFETRYQGKPVDPNGVIKG